MTETQELQEHMPAPISSHGEGAEERRGRVLFVDAYDSFANNIVDMLESQLSVSVTMIKIDAEIPASDFTSYVRQFDAVVLGPGPGNPANPGDVGLMDEIWSLKNADLVPVLGVCLGFQSLCLHHGAEVEQLPEPRHGRIVSVMNSGEGIFAGLPKDFEVTLYHSLVVKLRHRSETIWKEEWGSNWTASKVCPKIVPLSWCTDASLGCLPSVMAAKHVSKPFWGVQYHPESCTSSKYCQDLMKNWWAAATKWNTERGRTIQLTPPPTPLRQLRDDTEMTSNLVSRMEGILGYPGSVYCSQSVALRNLTTEMVCELLGTPYGDRVVFDANGRYSIISASSEGAFRLEYLPRRQEARISGTKIEVQPASSSEVIWNAVSQVMTNRRVNIGNDMSPFWGGFLGHASYEVGLEKFNISLSPEAKSQSPDMSLLWTDRSVVVDHLERQVFVQSIRPGDEYWVKETAFTLAGVPDTWDFEGILSHLAQENNGERQKDYDTRLQHSDGSLFNEMIKNSKFNVPSEKTYKKKIRDCQEYIGCGDSYELCLTSSASILIPPRKPSESDTIPRAWLLYRELRRYNPSLFSAYASLGRTRVVSSSPEKFMSWSRSGTVEMKPMKGTVSKTPNTTIEDARKILNTTKEKAENLMIADLIRHDLHGITNGPGHVRVKKLMEVEEHARVYQLVTHVEADLPPSRNPELTSAQAHGIHALASCLPPGSMTGAPKRRSCEILHALENRDRGIYSGVMGFLDVGGGGCFSVLIRTASCEVDEEKGEQGEMEWRIGAGGAITALSTEDGEWEEMITKMNTVLSVFKAKEEI